MLWEESLQQKLRIWGLWWRIANSAQVQNGESFLFSVEEEREVQPNMMVEAWKQLFGRGASGHSARRSGAMMYVRAGLPLQEIAFLGRWKSNVVLTYAEEALEEVPANARLLGAETRAQAVENSQTCRIGGRTSTTPMPRTPVPGTPAPGTPVLSTPARRSWSYEEEIPTAEYKEKEDAFTSKLLATDRSKELWVYSIRDNRSKRVLHRVEKAGWDVPLSKWRTTCGWTFASDKADAAFETRPNLLRIRCKKCVEINDKRDEVNGSTVWRLRIGQCLERSAENARARQRTTPSKKVHDAMPSLQRVEGGHGSD